MMYLPELIKKGIKSPSKAVNAFLNIWKNYNSRILIVSYQKTGRTWLRVMLDRAINIHFQTDQKMFIDIYKLSRMLGIGPINLTHGGRFNLYDFAPYQNLKIRAEKYRSKKIVFLIRDIRDVIVSHYFQFSKRENFFCGSMSEFIRDERLGIKKIITFYNLWYKNQSVPANFLLIRYEDMRRNPAEALISILNYIGVKEANNNTISQAVNYASFDNMKKLEIKGQIKDSCLRPGTVNDAESFKVRKGKVGGYSEYLSEEDINYIYKKIQELGIPGCDWYLWKS